MSEEKKVCPIFTKGWLGNKFAFGDRDFTFKPINLPKCIEEECMAWNTEHEYCKLIERSD